MQPDHGHHHHHPQQQHLAHEQPASSEHQMAIERPRGPKAKIASSALAATVSGSTPRSTLGWKRARGSLHSHSRSYSRSCSLSHNGTDTFLDAEADASQATRVLRLARLCNVQTQRSPASLHSYSRPEQHKESDAMRLEMPQPRRLWSRLGFDLLPLLHSATTTTPSSPFSPFVFKVTPEKSCFHYRQNYTFPSMPADADSVPDFTHDCESEFAEDAATDESSDTTATKTANTNNIRVHKDLFLQT
ncbi:hypothetical protein BC830DRAFT_1170989 [Chytriomyces sp. MP71]|nr:hypothetical protein BC830DRAFT_1170989 [Chytriomyces sp. MP71]